MKSKKNIYFLLPTVLIVWGLLGYRVFSTINPSNNQQIATNATVFKPRQFKEAKSFTINTSYRDPFLGTVQHKKKSKKRVVKVKNIQPFPTIKYKGVVASKTTKQQVFIISINGKHYFFKKHQKQQGLQLLKGNKKSITLKFQGQRQIFSIAN